MYQETHCQLYDHVCQQNQDDKLTFDEFLEGSKEDPTIIQALTLCDSGQA